MGRQRETVSEAAGFSNPSCRDMLFNRSAPLPPDGVGAASNAGSDARLDAGGGSEGSSASASARPTQPPPTFDPPDTLEPQPSPSPRPRPLGHQQRVSESGESMYVTVDLNDAGPRANVVRGAVGEAFDATACGGCPWTEPMCLSAEHAADGRARCVVPTCELFRPFCHAVSEAGVRTRQNCPVTCGCEHPASALALSLPSSGCGPQCSSSPAYLATLATLPCTDVSPKVDEARYSAAFAAYLDNALTAAVAWPPQVRNLVVEIVKTVQLEGCAALGPRGTLTAAGYASDDGRSPIDACRISGNDPNGGYQYQLPIKPMAVFCPESCGCVLENADWPRELHERWNCPVACYKARATSAPRPVSVPDGVPVPSPAPGSGQPLSGDPCGSLTAVACVRRCTQCLPPASAATDADGNGCETCVVPCNPHACCINPVFPCTP